MATYLAEIKVVYRGLLVLLHSLVEVAEGWQSCGADELVGHRLWGSFCWVLLRCWDVQAELGAAWAVGEQLVLHLQL